MDMGSGVYYRIIFTITIIINTNHTYDKIFQNTDLLRARGVTVGLVTALQAISSRYLFPVLSLEFFIDVILPTENGPGVDSASSTNEYQEYILGGEGGQCVGLTSFPTSCADCLEILGASNFCSPNGLSKAR
jgi:hypothetical protein